MQILNSNNERNIYSYIYVFRSNDFISSLHAGGGSMMLIGIVLGAALGWGG